MADDALVAQLEELLNSYLQSAGERELFRASELGRTLVDAGTRPEQLLAAHVVAMGRILSRLPPAAVADGALRSYQMLLEALMAYFMAYQPPVSTEARGTAENISAVGPSLDAFGLEHLYQQARGRAAQFRDLVEVGSALMVTPELTTALQQALARTMELTGSAVGAVWLLDAHGQPRWRTGEMKAMAPSLERVARQVLDDRETVVGGRQAAQLGDGGDGQLVFGVPLTPPDGVPVGALTIAMSDVNAEQADQSLDLLQLLGTQLGAAVATARLHEARQQNVEALVTLNAIGESLVQTLDPDEVCRVLLEGAVEFPGVVAAAIIPVEGWVFETQREAGDRELLTRRGSSATIRHARADVLESGRAEQVQTEAEPEAGTIWLLPLRPGGHTVGTLEVHLSTGTAFGGLLALLEGLAHHGASAIENARLYRSALAHEEALQDLVSRLITAQEEERRRVAYDIHDGLAQTTVATFQQLQLLAGRYRPRSPAAQSYLNGALHAGQRAVTEAREVIAGLRPTILDDFGLAAAIGREVELLRAEGREVLFEDRVASTRFTPEVETTLYRVTQESLTNIRKHAGPTAVQVTIEQVDSVLRLEVRDWGRGFAPAEAAAARRADHVGLAGMRERVVLLHGAFSIVGIPGAGTTITATVPIST